MLFFYNGIGLRPQINIHLLSYPLEAGECAIHCASRGQLPIHQVPAPSFEGAIGLKIVPTEFHEDRGHHPSTITTAVSVGMANCRTAGRLQGGTRANYKKMVSEFPIGIYNTGAIKRKVRSEGSDLYRNNTWVSKRESTTHHIPFINIIAPRLQVTCSLIQVAMNG
jgi:hypothetical protein